MLLAESLLGTSSTAANYIEDVFSTYLYTGTGSAQTITNGIDLSGKGGLVWLKSRNNPDSHYIVDTARGSNKVLYSNQTIAEETLTRFSSFNSSGFSLAATPSNPNVSGYTYASWTFRKQAKFFDVVTWTGNGGTSGRTISHNLGSVPGCIIVKNTTSAEDWYVYPASLGNTGTKQYFLILNSTAAQDTGGNGIEKASNWTSTQFALASGSSALNGSGQTYVAYLFAHNAGGFGATGSDNVISCGMYAGNGSGSGSNTISLGYEPQMLIIKRSTGGVGSWWMLDNMRGATASGNDALLSANSSAAETTDQKIAFTATGFTLYDSSAEFNASGSDYIYIAIRRGPMKTPTSGTSVFAPVSRTGTNANASITTGFPVDFGISRARSAAYSGYGAFDRLRGNVFSYTPLTDAEYSGTTYNVGLAYDSNTAMKVGADSNQSFINGYDPAGGYTGQYSSLFFRRAPGFFDVVCYTGNGGSLTVNHNLTVIPELLIAKSRTQAAGWGVYYNFGASTYNFAWLQLTNAGQGPYSYGPSVGADLASKPTASTFSWNGSTVNLFNITYVAYLFATVAGVSKVGSYTGSGTTKQIDCGFTGGARFVLIKRTDSTGDWYVWDTARGIVAGNDPYLRLNSTAAEVTSTDYIDTYSAGFEISSTAPAAINANGGSFIFWAVA